MGHVAQGKQDGRTGDKQPLVPAWLKGHPCFGVAAVLWSGPGGESYQRSLEMMGPSPRVLAPWMLKKMQNNKKKI